MRPLIVFDEAGNTGQDLINRDQPVFVQSSVLLTDEETKVLLDILLDNENEEAHFVRLKNSNIGRKKILTTLASDILTPFNAKLSYIHKGFMIISKAVDLLIEPLMHNDGVDLYENGGNIALSNLHFMCMPSLCGEEEASKFQLLFVNMIREKTYDSYMAFYDHIKCLIKNCSNNEYRKQLLVFYYTCTNIEYVLSTADIVSLDPAIPTFVQHCAEWGKSLGKKFDLIHDHSKPIMNKAHMLAWLMAEDEPDVLVGYDRRKMGLPLKATGINFADSKVVKQIQIADILGGACAYWAKGCINGNKDREKFWNSINNIPIDMHVFDSVWPSTNITPEELGTNKIGGICAVDYITDLIVRQKNKHGIST